MQAKVIQFPTPVMTYDQHLEVLFKDISHRMERAGYNDEQDLVVTFTMDADEWKALKKQGELGFLYNRDLSNFLSRRGILKHYAVPSVDDTARASKGRKRIQVRFGHR